MPSNNKYGLLEAKLMGNEVKKTLAEEQWRKVWMRYNIAVYSCHIHSQTNMIVASVHQERERKTERERGEEKDEAVASEAPAMEMDLKAGHQRGQQHCSDKWKLGK